ncbi:Pls/PosA family non-ribosomal peptide synthetase [Geodermatophilus sp. SYSU D00703]
MANPITVQTAAPAADPAVQDEHASPTGDTQAALSGVLADLVGVEQVPADSDFFQDLGADSMVMARFCARVRKRADLPTVSIKDVYQYPTIAALAAAVSPSGGAEPAPAGAEAAFAEVLAGVLEAEAVPVEAHFFDDLGADSMVMARFCARVRKRPDLPSVSIKDVYAHPTVRDLAAALATDVPAPAVPAAVETPAAARAAAPTVAHRATTGQYVLTGALQLLLFSAYCYLTGAVFVWSFEWISAGGSLVDDYLRAVVAGGTTFLVAVSLPILLKWLLVGRWKPQQIPIWTLGYVRFWLVKTLVMSNPLVLFAGSPVYNLYLRALGARVGRGAVVFTKHAPVCTDLITIGAGTVVRKEAYLNGYRAHSGWIQTGPVTIGANAFVGDKSVLDIGTSIGDGAQLGHASSLHAGQAVPAGERWHGSPAQPTSSDYQRIEPASCSTVRRAAYGTGQLLTTLLVYLPLAFGGVVAVLTSQPRLAALLEPGPAALTSVAFYQFALVLSLVLFFGGIVVRYLFVAAVAQVLGRAVKPDVVYPLYGLRYSIHRAVLHFANSKFFAVLTGDSSYVVGYLRSIGYRLGRPVVQTGSNFGNEVKHEAPTLTSVGRGTVVASGISFLHATYSSTSFRLSRTSLGADSFLGNDIVYPPDGRTGDNVLLATKVLVPIDGEVRENVGLLGSPAFEIPRTVERDSQFIQMAHDEQFPRRLAAKNRFNLRTIGLYLTAKWFYVFVLALLAMTVLDFLDELGVWAIALATPVVLLFSLVYFCLLEGAATRFRGLPPMHCSIYTRDFWRSERFFKFCARVAVHRMAVGTPFASVLWRIVGVRLGKRLFDDGVSMAEKTLVTIGDDVTLNAGSVVQCHSQEDYAFKSDRVSIGSGCTLGVAAFVHYGVTAGDDVVLAADSFLMKGEEVPDGERWGGNPAREMPEALTPATPPQLPAPRPAADSAALAGTR